MKATICSLKTCNKEKLLPLVKINLPTIETITITKIEINSIKIKIEISKISKIVVVNASRFIWQKT
jgi:hypothetical protein